MSESEIGACIQSMPSIAASYFAVVFFMIGNQFACNFQ